MKPFSYTISGFVAQKAPPIFRGIALKVGLTVTCVLSDGLCFGQLGAANPSSGKNEPTASSASSSGEVKKTLTEVAKRRASRILGRYVPASEFFVSIDAQGKADALEAVPYLPAAQTVDLLMDADSTELASMYTTLKVQIWLNKRFDKETRKSLSLLVRQDLGIEKETDVTFKDMQIETGVSDSSMQRALEKTEADLRQAQSDLKTLERERNDLKTASLLNDKKMDPKSESEAEVGEEAKPDVSLIKRLIDALPILLGIVLAAVFIFISAKMFASSVRSVGSGVSSVATALAGINGNLNIKQEKEADQSHKKQDGPNEAPAQVAAASAGHGMDGKGIQERLTLLHEELLAAMNDRTEAILLSSLTESLIRPESVAKAVATLELLGKEKANAVFTRLGKYPQSTVLEFLQSGNYGRPKFEVMLEAGEELKTRLLGEGFGRLRGELSLKMTERMLKLSETDIPEVLMSLPEKFQPRFMLYLESDALANLIAKLALKEVGVLENILDQLASIADVEKSIDLDDPISELIDKWLASRKDDVQSKYVPYYQKLLESLDGDLAEKTVERLASQNATLKDRLEGFVVTLNTLYKLPPDPRRSVLESLNNKQLGALLFGIENEKAGDILSCINERRVELIRDELEVVKQQTPTASKKLFLDVKSQVVAKLKVMRDSGELRDHLNGSNGSSETAVNTPPKAA